MSDRLWTSESVTEGHPDKMADQVSDAVLDEILKNDPDARVAVETLLTTGAAIVAGEVTTRAYVDMADVVRKTLEAIGYSESAHGFAGGTCGVLLAIQEQSRDIALGVDDGGAGDQGMMFGYATDETEQMMPSPILYAHHLTKALADVRKSGVLPWLRPDGKSQVSVRYHGDQPVHIDTVVIACHHSPDVDCATIRSEVMESVVLPTLPAHLVDETTEYLINRTGRFEIGGPQADTGLTGRKIIVDTYGGLARHGGGCFSGKDPSKVDRSAAYMARHMAKNIVAAGAAKRCEIQISYCIGHAQPVSLVVETFGTGRVDDGEITRVLRETFDLSPRGIVEYLDLRRPIYLKTASYGHFGRSDPDFTWERTHRAADLQSALGL
ncbi:MAG: methionine adenosyltransferase [candidate division WS1 bacterium]|nr:methionine adenosyltransferase [candidate division WS1 bacterium]